MSNSMKSAATVVIRRFSVRRSRRCVACGGFVIGKGARVYCRSERGVWGFRLMHSFGTLC